MPQLLIKGLWVRSGWRTFGEPMSQQVVYNGRITEFTRVYYSIKSYIILFLYLEGCRVDTPNHEEFCIFDDNKNPALNSVNSPLQFPTFMFLSDGKHWILSFKEGRVHPTLPLIPAQP